METKVNIRKVKVNVKDCIIEYDEHYVTDSNGEEVFDRKIEIENDIRLYDLYKKKVGLLTSSEIKNIRRKYGLSQKDFALVLGVGEVTIHRFENGSLQTESIDSIIRLADNPDNMHSLLLKNGKNIDKKVYDFVMERVTKLQVMKKHALVDVSKFDLDILDFKEESALEIAKHIIKIYNDGVDEVAANYNIEPEYITSLKLQKLLYFVQALSLVIFNKRAFPEKILAWSYGPVINEVYQEFKKNNKEIETNFKTKKISIGMYSLILEVVSSYGAIEATKLIDFTHEEDPWKSTKLNSEISLDLIKSYYSELYKDTL